MRLVSTHMCMTRDLGRNDNLYGGIMLEWIDEAASVYAYSLTGEPRMVTYRIGEIYFRQDAKLGDIIEIHCGNYRTTTSSVTFDIDVRRCGTTVAHCDATFVAIDEQGNKKPIERDIPPCGDPS